MFYRRRGFCVLLPSLARTLVLEKGHKQTRATVDQAAFSSLLLPQKRTLWLRRGEDPGPPPAAAMAGSWQVLITDWCPTGVRGEELAEIAIENSHTVVVEKFLPSLWLA